MNKLGFLFPGQGSQTVGMLDSFLSDTRFTGVVSGLLDAADQALGQSLSTIIAKGPAEDLNLTINTQPAMLTADVAVYECWKSLSGLVPNMVAGHSLGEYAALVAAGTIRFDDAVRLVRFRANAMQQAVPVGQGGMAAVLGLADEQVIEVCNQASCGAEVVQAVNFNAPSQVVIAGSAAAVNRACELAKAAGAKRALTLPVSAPFHSSLMDPAGQALAGEIATITLSSPRIPYINNVDVSSLSDPSDISDALVRQASKPVRWVQTILAMQSQGVSHFVECGPGKVLAGLVKRICDVPVYSVFDVPSLEQTLQAING